MTPSTGAEPMPSKPAGHRDSAAAPLSIRDAGPAGTHDRRAFLKGVGHAGLAARRGVGREPLGPGWWARDWGCCAPTRRPRGRRA